MRKVIFRVLLAVFIALFVVSGFFIGKYLYDSKKAESVFNDFSATLQEIINAYETGPENRPPGQTANSGPGAGEATGSSAPEGSGEYETGAVVTDPRLLAYRDMNLMYPDMVGRIKIPGTVVDYPVMYTPNDPEYYLDHDIDKAYSSHGAPFLDFKCDIERPSDNLIIYAHHMKDGSMFACLNRYKNKSFLEEHPTVEFHTLYDIGYYEVVAIFVSHIGADGKYAFEYFLYTDFGGRGEFDDFMDLVREYRLYDSGTEAVYGDRLLSLSTCDYTGSNSRMVLLARKI